MSRDPEGGRSLHEGPNFIKVVQFMKIYISSALFKFIPESDSEGFPFSCSLSLAPCRSAGGPVDGLPRLLETYDPSKINENIL